MYRLENELVRHLRDGFPQSPRAPSSDPRPFIACLGLVKIGLANARRHIIRQIQISALQIQILLAALASTLEFRTAPTAGPHLCGSPCAAINWARIVHFT